MTDQSPTANAVEAALQNLRSRQPKPRGRRQELAPYVDQLRELLAAGWTRSEIIGEIKALGGQMSPALLRDVLQLPPAQPKHASRPKQINRQRQANSLPQPRHRQLPNRLPRRRQPIMTNRPRRSGRFMTVRRLMAQNNQLRPA